MGERILRPGIRNSERTAALVADAGWMSQVFYDWLLTLVDDYGRYDARPSVLRAELFPLLLNIVRETDVSRCLAACEKAGLVRLYSIEGKPFVEVLNFRQRLRAKHSRFPSPPENAGGVALSRQGHDSGVTLSRQCHDNANGDGDGDGDGNPPNPPDARTPATVIPPPIDAVQRYMGTLKLPPEEAQKFMDFYESKGWLVGKARMKNWQASCRNWQRNYHESRVTKTPPAKPQLGDDLPWDDRHTPDEIRQICGGDDAE